MIKATSKITGAVLAIGLFAAMALPAFAENNCDANGPGNDSTECSQEFDLETGAAAGAETAPAATRE